MSLGDSLSRMVRVFAHLGFILLLLSFPLQTLNPYRVPWGFVIFLMAMPTMMALLQLALSPSREFAADFAAAELTDDSIPLARALKKLEWHTRGLWERIILPSHHEKETSLLRTHPSTEERVRRLIELVEETPSSRSLPIPAFTGGGRRLPSPLYLIATTPESPAIDSRVSGNGDFVLAQNTC